MYIVISYSFYLVISLAATIWVAQTLYRNGRVFLIDAFHGNAELAASVNHLLVVGFYLINVGYVTLALRTGAEVTGVRQVIELVCDKIGLVLVVLGVMHFLNLYIFNALRKLRRLSDARADSSPGAPPAWRRGANADKILD